MGLRGWLGRWRGGSCHSCGAWRDGNPQDDVGEQPCSPAQKREQPHDTNNGWVEVEVVGQASGYAGDLLVCRRAHETPSRWARDSVCGRSPRRGLLGAAVVPEIGTVRDFLLTICADHGFTSAGRCKRTFYCHILMIDTDWEQIKFPGPDGLYGDGGLRLARACEKPQVQTPRPFETQGKPELVS